MSIERQIPKQKPQQPETQTIVTAGRSDGIIKQMPAEEYSKLLSLLDDLIDGTPCSEVEKSINKK